MRGQCQTSAIESNKSRQTRKNRMVEAVPAEGLEMGRESPHKTGMVWPSQPGPYRSVLALFCLFVCFFYIVQSFICFLLWFVI